MSRPASPPVDDRRADAARRRELRGGLHRIGAAAALCVLTAAGLTACGSDPGSGTAEPAPTTSTTADAGTLPSVDAVPPLPADAELVDLDALPPAPSENCELFETLPPNDQKPEELVPKILARGRLIVGLDQGSNLFSFRDPVSGQLEGFDVDLAKEIARDIFGSPERVEFRSLTSAERIEALQNGRVDVVVKSMSITCERRQSVRFSAPYYSANQRLLTLRGNGIEELADLDGKRVCVARGTTSASRLRDVTDTLQVLTVNTWADCLVAIQQDQVDAVTTDDAILAGMAAQDPNLQIVGAQVAAEPYGVGIAQSTPGNNTDGLVRQVNKTLERIRSDGRWNEMFSHWLGGYSSSSTMPAPTYVDSDPAGEGR